VGGKEFLPGDAPSGGTAIVATVYGYGEEALPGFMLLCGRLQPLLRGSMFRFVWLSPRVLFIWEELFHPGGH
jgi:hypothetical protein